ncbi:hypothetical protein [Plantactinospora sp. GCM10030261]|uniref:hypothetical protein n=1 Tax=Plantactinospora sp. GCM10030261 TaxID=3273420 RepID=UPI003606C8E3
MADDPFQEWLGKVHVRIELLSDEDLPGDLRFDYSAASLARLESVLLERFADPLDVLASGSHELVLGAAAYLGESLLRAGGGSWIPDPEPAAPFPRPAIVSPDPALGLPAVFPMRTIAAAVGSRDGQHFAELFEKWQRAAEQTGSVLSRWLARWEAEFPDWIATYAPGEAWDFSPESLDALESLARRVTPSPEDLLSPGRADFRGGAAWYVGEVFRRALGGQWDSDRDSEFLRQVGPHRGKIIPVVTLKRSLQDPGRLRKRYDAFAAMQ